MVLVIHNTTYYIWFGIVEISNKSANVLESVHCGMAKLVQGLPIQTVNMLSLPALGWWSMTYLCYKRAVLL